MSGLEALGAVVGVIAVVAQIVSAYRDGGSIIDNIKAKRAAKRGRPLPRQLEESVRETPEDIEREKNRGLAKFGPAFEQGDYIAIITIQQIAIQVHSKFFENLRNAYDEDTDFTALISDADMGRNNTIRALIELQQRLHLAAPIQSAPLFASAPPQSFGQSGEGDISLAQVAQLPPAENQNQHLLESPVQPQANAGRPIRDQRQHRFSLFHRSREQAQPPRGSQGSPSHSPEPGQGSFGRVYTLPTTTSNAANLSHSQTNTSDAQQRPSMSTVHSQSLPRNYRQSPTQINTPWENPWAEEAQPLPQPPSSYPIQPHPQPSFSYPLQPDHALPLMAQPTRTFTSQSGSSSNSNPSSISAASTPHPNPSNNYLGFCKGAWKLQDGDRGAMVESRDFTQSAQSKVRIMRCSECKFEGHFHPDKIWTLVFRFESLQMKIRWSFLAKSHVRQRYPQSRDLARNCEFTYQCIFCAFLGLHSPAIHGAKAYRDHISQMHHGAALSEVVLYKAGAVDDRVCEDGEEFDINLYPRRVSRASELSGISF